MRLKKSQLRLLAFVAGFGDCNGQSDTLGENMAFLSLKGNFFGIGSILSYNVCRRIKVYFHNYIRRCNNSL